MRLPHWLRHDWTKWQRYAHDYVLVTNEGKPNESREEISETVRARYCMTCKKFQRQVVPTTPEDVLRLMQNIEREMKSQGKYRPNAYERTISELNGNQPQ